MEFLFVLRYLYKALYRPIFMQFLFILLLGAPNKGDPDNDEELYKYMLIPVGVICLIIGLALGCMAHRYHKAKTTYKNNNGLQLLLVCFVAAFSHIFLHNMLSIILKCLACSPFYQFMALLKKSEILLPLLLF